MVGLEWYQELATILLNYHIGRIVLGSMCVGVSVWVGWSGIRVAGCNTDTFKGLIFVLPVFDLRAI